MLYRDDGGYAFSGELGRAERRAEFHRAWRLGRELDPDELFFPENEDRALVKAQDEATDMALAFGRATVRACMFEMSYSGCREIAAAPRPAAVRLEHFVEWHARYMLSDEQRQRIGRGARARAAYRLWTQIVFELYLQRSASECPGIKPGVSVWKTAAEIYALGHENTDPASVELFGDPSEVGLARARQRLDALLRSDPYAREGDLTRPYLESLGDPAIDAHLRYAQLLARLREERLRSDDLEYDAARVERLKTRRPVLPPLPVPPPVPPRRRQLPPLPAVPVRRQPPPSIRDVPPLPIQEPKLPPQPNPTFAESIKSGVSNKSRDSDRSRESASRTGLSRETARRPPGEGWTRRASLGTTTATEWHVTATNLSSSTLYGRVFAVREPLFCSEPCPIEEVLAVRSPLYSIRPGHAGLLRYTPIPVFERARPGRTLRLFWSANPTNLRSPGQHLTEPADRVDVHHMRLTHDAQPVVIA